MITKRTESKNGDSGEGLDTRSCHNKIKLRKIFLNSGQNERFQIELAQLKAVHVGTDNVELFSLFHTHLSIHGGQDLFIYSFHPLGVERGHI